MTRPATLVLVALALVVQPAVGLAGSVVEPDAGASADAAIQPEPRGSILIEGDEDFEQPTAVSGVRSGNGTAENPYVISNWTIRHTRAEGILLEDTRSHVVIEDVRIDAPEGRAVRYPYCAPDGRLPGPVTPTCEGPRGIDLQNATNVTIHNVDIGAETWGVRIEDARNVTVERFHAEPPLDTETDALILIGIGVEASTGVQIRNATIRHALATLRVTNTSHVRVQDTTLVDGGVPVASNTRDVAFHRTLFEDATVIASQRVRGLDIAHSRFTEDIGLHGSQPGFRGVSVCGSSFQANGTLGVDLHAAEDLAFRGNVFENSDVGAVIQSSANLTFERNLVRDNANSGIDVGVDDASIHNNSFVRNEGHFVSDDADLARNWWDDPSGPRVVEFLTGEVLREGEGETVTVSPDKDITFDPPLEESPKVGPKAVDCGVPDGPVGAQQGPGLAYTADASAHVQADPASAHASAHAEVPGP